MTKSYEFFKEDVEPTELDDIIYNIERQHLVEQEYLDWENKQNKIKFAKIKLLNKPRYANREPERYAVIHGIREALPF